MWNDKNQKALPGDSLCKCLTPGCQRYWTSPRWSWSSRKNFKTLFSSSTITSVTTTLSKSHSLGHPLEMPYSWLSEVLDLTQMVMDIWRQLQTIVFILYHNFCFNKIVKKPFPGTPLGDALLLSVRGAGPHPNGHGHLVTIKNKYTQYDQQLLLSELFSKLPPDLKKI